MGAVHSPVEETCRIEQLPDDVLLYILSFLPSLAEKSRTSILSSRWRYLCRYITRLDFDASSMLHPGESRLERLHQSHDWYISWVNSVIERRVIAAELPLVKDLLIRYKLNRKHGRHIHKWISFAIAHRIETLHLDFGFDYPRKQFKLSEKLLYRARSGLSSIKCLKSLFLASVNVSNKFVQLILSNCPLLEDLTLDAAVSFTHLDVSSVPPLRLKRLKIRLTEENSALAILSAPYLTSFYHISFAYSPRMIHVPMLTELTVGNLGRTPRANEYLEHFWSYLPQLKKFELVLFRPQDFKFTQMPELVHLRCLKMTTYWNSDLIFKEIIKFINVCPLLETFALGCLHMKSRRAIRKPPLLESEQHRSNQKWYCEMEKNCVFESLKVLELYGADGKTTDLEVVECIISKSPNLENLMVDTRRLFSYPNSGPDIVEVAKAKAQVLCRGRCPEIDIKVIG